MEIDVNTIGAAHEAVVRTLIEEGEQQDIQTHADKIERTWEFHDPVTIIVRTPNKAPVSSPACTFGEKSMEKYSRDFTGLTPPRPDGMGATYTYGNRLFDYRGNGDGTGLNQIETIIDRLSKSMTSRRANAITWIPEIDSKSDEPPCLQFTHVLIRNCRYVWKTGDPPKLVRQDAADLGLDGFLHARFPFRSHDMLSGYGANAVGLTSLMKFIMERLMWRTGWTLDFGSLTTFSSCAHLYWVRDDKELKEFKKVLGIS